ncbi:hypothetical protein MC885_016623 [Smutsia gigantea]|nr:hypothetical protein MC885_016623 [Smutsia gigantea]
MKDEGLVFQKNKQTGPTLNPPVRGQLSGRQLCPADLGFGPDLRSQPLDTFPSGLASQGAGRAACYLQRRGRNCHPSYSQNMSKGHILKIFCINDFGKVEARENHFRPESFFLQKFKPNKRLGRLAGIGRQLRPPVLHSEGKPGSSGKTLADSKVLSDEEQGASPSQPSVTE